MASSLNHGITDSATNREAGCALREKIHSEIFTMLKEQDTLVRDAISMALSEKNTRLFMELTKKVDEALNMASGTNMALPVEMPPLADIDNRQTALKAYSMKTDAHKALRQAASEESCESKQRPKKVPGIRASCLDEEKAFAKFGTVESFLDIDLSYLKGCVSRKRLPKCATNFAAAIVYNSWFETLISVCILLNAGLIAWSINHSMVLAMDNFHSLQHGQARTTPRIRKTIVPLVDVGFATIFSIEMVLRFMAQELIYIFGHHARWNLLDISLVIIGWIDVGVTLSTSNGSASFSVMRLVRMLRILRSFRVIKVLHMFSEMRVVLLSFFGAIVPMFWTMLGMCVILYIFVSIFVQGAAGFVTEAPYGEPLVESSIRPYFGSFLKTYRTLLMAITGGEDWTKYYDILQKVSPFYALLFVVYIVMMAFGALNIITAIFVERSLSKAREDFELQKVEERSKMESQRKKLVKLFRQFDTEMTGQITKDRWKEMIGSDDMQKVHEYFSMLKIDISKADDVFRLLDVDDSGILELEEFIGGCMHIQGTASFVDVDMLMTATKTMMKRCACSFDAIKARIHEEHSKSQATLNKVLERIALLDSRIRDGDQSTLQVYV